MKFYTENVKKIKKFSNKTSICLCHTDYNHCVANNENGEIPNIVPNLDLHLINFTENFVKSFLETNDNVEKNISTTEKPEEAQALGFQVKTDLFFLKNFQELTDEIAINAQARQNLMFVVEEKPLDDRIKLSQAKNELILKCSFNQRDCNIEKYVKKK